MILLDTNVWSELSKPKANPQVVAWLADHQLDLWLSSIVIAELRFGIELSDAAEKRETLERWLSDLEILYAERVLTFDRIAAHVFGRLAAHRRIDRHPTKILDLQIAAQGLAHRIPVATRNIADFAWTGVELIDPWSS